jgi:hypothetical protein
LQRWGGSAAAAVRIFPTKGTEGARGKEGSRIREIKRAALYGASPIVAPKTVGYRQGRQTGGTEDKAGLFLLGVFRRISNGNSDTVTGVHPCVRRRGRFLGGRKYSTSRREKRRNSDLWNITTSFRKTIYLFSPTMENSFGMIRLEFTTHSHQIKSNSCKPYLFAPNAPLESPLHPKQRRPTDSTSYQPRDRRTAEQATTTNDERHSCC